MSDLTFVRLAELIERLKRQVESKDDEFIVDLSELEALIAALTIRVEFLESQTDEIGVYIDPADNQLLTADPLQLQVISSPGSALLKLRSGEPPRAEGSPSNPQDLATKAYVDGLISFVLGSIPPIIPGSSGTMSGVVNILCPDVLIGGVPNVSSRSLNTGQGLVGYNYGEVDPPNNFLPVLATGGDFINTYVMSTSYLALQAIQVYAQILQDVVGTGPNVFADHEYFLEVWRSATVNGTYALITTVQIASRRVEWDSPPPVVVNMSCAGSAPAFVNPGDVLGVRIRCVTQGTNPVKSSTITAVPTNPSARLNISFTTV
jgi:hypothetical protein